MSLYAIKKDDGTLVDTCGDTVNENLERGMYFEAEPNKSKAERYARQFGGHMVELVEEQKVKLPREVGEELDEYKRGFEHDIDVLGFLTDLDYLMELNKTYAWIYESYGDRSSRVNRLIDAYRYGWEAETEAKWYVQTPKEWWAQPDAPEYMILDQLGVVSGIGSKKFVDKFTHAELKKYRLNSDIFTLVPAEDNDDEE